MACGKAICSFSPDQAEYFAYSSPDGCLKIWETGSNLLKQEYTPSAHLTSACSALSWAPPSCKQRADAISPKKRTKRSRSWNLASKICDLKLVAMGTLSGDTFLYSVKSGDLHSKLSDGHIDTVNGISWLVEEDAVFTCSSDQHIIRWSISEGIINSKWKAGQQPVHCICVMDSNNLLSASCSITWWDIRTQSSLKIKVKVHKKKAEEYSPGDDSLCEVCGRGDREDRLLLCDSCDMAYHCECLTPPLDDIPVNEWFCPNCAPVVERRSGQNNSSGARIIPRTRVTETVRASIQRIRTQASAGEDDWEDLQPSTSRGVRARPKPQRKTVRRKRRKRTVRKKSTLARTKKSVQRNKTSGKRISSTSTSTRRKSAKKYRRRRMKGKKSSRSKRSRFMSRPLAAPSSTKKRIADRLGLCKPPSGISVPYVKKPSSGSGSVTERSTLRIFGARDQLMDFEEDFTNQSSSSQASTSTYPEKIVQSGTIDLLGTILAGQTVLHKASEDIVIGTDGTLKINTSIDHRQIQKQKSHHASKSSGESTNCSPLHSHTCSSGGVNIKKENISILSDNQVYNTTPTLASSLEKFSFRPVKKQRISRIPNNESSLANLYGIMRDSETETMRTSSPQKATKHDKSVSNLNKKILNHHKKNEKHGKKSSSGLCSYISSLIDPADADSDDITSDQNHHSTRTIVDPSRRKFDDTRANSNDIDIAATNDSHVSKIDSYGRSCSTSSISNLDKTNRGEKGKYHCENGSESQAKKLNIKCEASKNYVESIFSTEATDNLVYSTANETQLKKFAVGDSFSISDVEKFIKKEKCEDGEEEEGENRRHENCHDYKESFSTNKTVSEMNSSSQSQSVLPRSSSSSKLPVPKAKINPTQGSTRNNIPNSAECDINCKELSNCHFKSPDNVSACWIKKEKIEVDESPENPEACCSIPSDGFFAPISQTSLNNQPHSTVLDHIENTSRSKEEKNSENDKSSFQSLKNVDNHRALNETLKPVDRTSEQSANEIIENHNGNEKPSTKSNNISQCDSACKEDLEDDKNNRIMKSDTAQNCNDDSDVAIKPITTHSNKDFRPFKDEISNSSTTSIGRHIPVISMPKYTGSRIIKRNPNSCIGRRTFSYSDDSGTCTDDADNSNSLDQQLIKQVEGEIFQNDETCFKHIVKKSEIDDRSLQCELKPKNDDDDENAQSTVIAGSSSKGDVLDDSLLFNVMAVISGKPCPGVSPFKKVKKEKIDDFDTVESNTSCSIDVEMVPLAITDKNDKFTKLLSKDFDKNNILDFVESDTKGPGFHRSDVKSFKPVKIKTEIVIDDDDDYYQKMNQIISRSCDSDRKESPLKRVIKDENVSVKRFKSSDSESSIMQNDFYSDETKKSYKLVHVYKMSQDEVVKKVEEEVKIVLKPFYSRKEITKDMYKDIMRKCVPKKMGVTPIARFRKKEAASAGISYCPAAASCLPQMESDLWLPQQVPFEAIENGSRIIKRAFL